MINVVIPDNNIPERSYSIEMVLHHFLGIEISISPQNCDCTTLSWSNKKIVIHDAFWDSGTPLSYLSKDKLPIIRRTRLHFSPENDFVILYGNKDLILGENEIYCGIDVFASVFFLLTRWEEYVVNTRDYLGRFIGSNSILYKNNVIDRPLLNEYIEFIWAILKSIGCEEKRSERTFHLVPTHDVDHPYMKHRFCQTSKNLIKCFLRRDFLSIPYYLRDYFKDPFYIYPFFMDISEEIGEKSIFYFMSSDPSITRRGVTPYSERRLLKIANSILHRNHKIGIHPGFFADNEQQVSKEKTLLESIIKVHIDEGRMHYLKFIVPQSYNNLCNNDIILDSTLSYHDVEGFRCGTGDAFPVFDFIKREKLGICERPLIVMDTTIDCYKNYTINKIRSVLCTYIAVAKKYNMTFTILFHNSSFTGKRGNDLKKLYKEVLLSLKNRD